MNHYVFSSSVNIGRNRGVSLIEVLIAVLVLSIGVLGLAALQGVSLQANQSAYHRTQATNLAYEIADYTRVNRSAAINSGAVPLLPAWQNFVDQRLPNGALTVTWNGAIEEIVVTVTWDESRLSDAPGGKEQVQIRTRI